MDNSELRELLAKATQTYGERQALVIRGKDHVAINRARHDFELAAAALMPDMPRLLADSDELAKLRAEIAGAPVGVLRDANLPVGEVEAG